MTNIYQTSPTLVESSRDGVSLLHLNNYIYIFTYNVITHNLFSKDEVCFFRVVPFRLKLVVGTVVAVIYRDKNIVEALKAGTD
jgi:hypothetical protein